ncbi:MAG: hypothetical protein M0Q13_11105 [Methanothrix sp.]|nr:hypothetical protein [Methanothrix sp.]
MKRLRWQKSLAEIIGIAEKAVLSVVLPRPRTRTLADVGTWPWADARGAQARDSLRLRLAKGRQL